MLHGSHARSAVTAERAVTCQQHVGNRCGESVQLVHHTTLGAFMTNSLAEQAAATISRGIGRRGFAQAVAGLVAGVGIAGSSAFSSAGQAGKPGASGSPTPGAGPI